MLRRHKAQVVVRVGDGGLSESGAAGWAFDWHGPEEQTIPLGYYPSQFPGKESFHPTPIKYKDVGTLRLIIIDLR